MTPVLLLVYKLTALFGYGAAFVYYMHMFQLNSYHADVQMRWLKVNFRAAYLVRVLPALVSVACAFFGNVGYIVGAVCHVLYLLANFPRKAKKPLVFTARVWRMTVTFVLVSALICAAGAFAFDVPVVYPLLLLVPCFLILLANLLNKPVEKAVCDHYIREAKEKIDALPNLTVIGITGSYGKTSTKFYLQKLLSSKYNVLMTPESYNTTMGVVKTVREMLDATYDIFLCEMGAKNVGEIKEICDIVRPKYGIITSIGPQHLESFKTMDNIIRTKFELCDALPEDGVIFLNGDTPEIAAHTPSRKAVYYGLEHPETEDYFAKNVRVDETGTTFTAVHGKEEYAYSTKLLAKHSVTNIIGCIAVASFLGCTPEKLAMPVRRLEPAPHRLTIRGGGEVTIIDDAFNSNPRGSRAALEVLERFSGVRILITPGMIELGDKEEEYNRAFGAYAASRCDYVFLVGDRITKSIAAGLSDEGYPEERVVTVAKVTDAIAQAAALEPGKKKFLLLENDLPDNY